MNQDQRIEFGLLVTHVIIGLNCRGHRRLARLIETEALRVMERSRENDDRTRDEMTEPAKPYIVDQAYYWRPIETAPLGSKIQLLTLGMAAVHGVVSERNRADYLGWTPLPNVPAFIKERTK